MGTPATCLDYVQQTAPKTHLRNLACPSETSTTMISGGVCSYEEGSQLAQALVFLRAHARTTTLVTLTIGANDVTGCLTNGEGNPATIQTCTNDALAVYGQNLTSILAAVHAAAPDARVVITNYYNPFLALYFTAQSGLVPLTSLLQAALNTVILNAEKAVLGSGGAVADVASAFHSYETAPAPGTTVPLNVATVCTLTWMCTKGDIHPNDQGYVVIGEAVAMALKTL